MLKSLFFVPVAVAVSALIMPKDSSMMETSGMDMPMPMPMEAVGDAIGTAMNAADMSMDAILIPSDRAAAPTDTDILNYALTLEHLENAFYSGALSQFNNETFSAAGLNRGLYVQIGQHESEHVAFLSGALGSAATQPCNYSFPYTDVKSFAALSRVLEGVGDSAYLGAASYIQNKTYLTAAASILSVEARHAAWISSSENDQVPWNGALDVPLSLSQVYSLAAPFITSCPSSNPQLPVESFPALAVTNTNYSAGGPLSLNFNGTSNSSLYVTFFSGLTQLTVPYNNGSLSIPNELGQMGVVYAIVTNGNGTASDDNTVAGPVILNFPTNVTVDISTGGNGTGSNGTQLSSSNSAFSSITSFSVRNTFYVLFATAVLSLITF